MSLYLDMLDFFHLSISFRIYTPHDNVAVYIGLFKQKSCLCWASLGLLLYPGEVLRVGFRAINSMAAPGACSGKVPSAFPEGNYCHPPDP